MKNVFAFDQRILSLAQRIQLGIIPLKATPPNQIPHYGSCLSLGEGNQEMWSIQLTSKSFVGDTPWSYISNNIPEDTLAELKQNGITGIKTPTYAGLLSANQTGEPDILETDFAPPLWYQS